MKFLIEGELDRVWVTADHHFGHENIIGFCNRPVSDVGEMDKMLIDNWNEVVAPTDLVIHLGDFTLGGVTQAQEYFAQLNGTICVMEYSWHHDKRWVKTHLQLKSKSGANVKLFPPMVVLEVPKLGDGTYPLAITLCHYPMAVWDRKHHGAWHLHGHSHGKYRPPHQDDLGYACQDIGVDCCDFRPLNLAQVSIRIAECMECGGGF